MSDADKATADAAGGAASEGTLLITITNFAVQAISGGSVEALFCLMVRPIISP